MSQYPFNILNCHALEVMSRKYSYFAREELTAELLQLQLTPTLNTVLFDDAPSGNLPELVIAV